MSEPTPTLLTNEEIARLQYDTGALAELLCGLPDTHRY